MSSQETESFASLVEQYLGERLPPETASEVNFSDLPAEARGFALRMLGLMKEAGYSAANFNPYLIHWITKTVPTILPGAWGGRIPPLTLPGRHKKLDDLVAGRAEARGNAPPVFVDMGCGFPPVTSADTARRLPDWQVYGVDRSFNEYVLYDPEGHYACFDATGEYRYFQAMMTLSGRAMYADPVGTGNKFKDLFRDMHPLLRDTDGQAAETVEKDGHKLIRNHIREFETDNLTFLKSDIRDLELPPATAVRCMNVLVYFDEETKNRMVRQAGGLLHEGGMMIAGTNGLGVQSRYTVFQKTRDGLVPDEFAFSLDNLGHLVFMPWFTIHENDPEASLLAELTGTIRGDRSLWPDFSRRQDELLKHHEICLRDPDGFLQFPQTDRSPAQYLEQAALLWQQIVDEGFVDRILESLGRAGYEARQNPVGDIAVRPPEGLFDLD